MKCVGHASRYVNDGSGSSSLPALTEEKEHLALEHIERLLVFAVNMREDSPAGRDDAFEHGQILGTRLGSDLERDVVAPRHSTPALVRPDDPHVSTAFDCRVPIESQPGTSCARRLREPGAPAVGSLDGVR